MKKTVKKAVKNKSTVIEKLAKKIKTPEQAQKLLKSFTYNKKDTLRSAEQTIVHRTAHCCEGAFAVAAILEIHGFPPLVVSFESTDGVDHVIFVFKRGSKWGAVGQSRDEGLFGREPIYRSIRDLAWSYFDPYVDETGMITGYRLANLDDSKANWRYSSRNVWKAENYLLKIRHKKLKSSKKRHAKLRQDHITKGSMKWRKNWW